MADTILVVDDSVTVRTVVRWVAETTGARVLEAASLREASDVLSSETPSVVVLDYHLPDGAGVDFCRTLRANNAFDAVRIILLHGDHHPFEADDAIAAQANGLLRKPFRSQALIDVLQGDLPPLTASAPAPASTVAAPPAPSSVEQAMSAASQDDDIIFSSADAASQSRATIPPPPTSGSGVARLPRAPGQSGVHRLPPVPGQSGVHRLPPPPGGRTGAPPPVTGAHRTVSGAHRPLADLPAANDSQPTGPVRTLAPDASAEATAERAPMERAPIAPRRDDATAEIQPLAPAELAAVPTPPPAPAPVAQATSVPAGISEEQLRLIVEEQVRAVVEEVLPGIARQALAGILKTELNEQVVRMGVTRRVAQFLEQDLPRYAQSAVDRRLNQGND